MRHASTISLVSRQQLPNTADCAQQKTPYPGPRVSRTVALTRGTYTPKQAQKAMVVFRKGVIEAHRVGSRAIQCLADVLVLEQNDWSR